MKPESEMKKLLTGIDGGLKKQNERMDAIEEENKTLRDALHRASSRDGVSLPGVDLEKDKFSFRKAILCITTKEWDNPEWGFESDVLRQVAKKGGREYQKRTLSAGVDSAGGYIVPNEYVGEIIELLRARMVTEQMGARVLSGLSGAPVELSRQTGGATFAWVGENATITASDQALGDVVLTPKQGAAMTQISNRLLRLSSPSAEAFVRDDLAKVMGLGLDLAYLQGTGGSNQPLGIANTPSILTTSMNAAPSVDSLYDMVYQVELNNADNGQLGWVMHPRTWNTLRKLKGGDGHYILTTEPNPGNVVGTARPAARGTLLGYPFATSTQVPVTLGGTSDRSRITLGNWDEAMVGLWGGLEIKASQEAGTSFATDQTWIRILQETDFAVRHAASFCTDSTVST